jgi:3-dehydroquinate dehydratase/shikimate dehydrogenase
MITVPSIAPGTAAGGRRLLRQLMGRAALVEVRLDRAGSADLRHLLGGKRPPVIVTYRSRAEGGRWAGSVRGTVSRLERALRAGAEFIDVEERLGRAAISRLSAIGGTGRIILSHHDPEGTPRNAVSIFKRMVKYRPAMVKYAAHANSFRDTLACSRLLRLASTLGQPAVALAMGEYGTYTRILQGVLGGALSFAAPDGGRPTAPGQLTIGELDVLYRASSITDRTKLFGLVGNPVSSSPGTMYHNAVFTRLRRDAVYLNFLVDDIGLFMSTTAGLCSGLSVTMPFKSSVIPFVDHLHSSAAVSGSVNTIVRRSGRTVGINTDYLAFIDLLNNATPPRGKRLLLIGTGGTARSVAAAATSMGAKLTIAGRRPPKAMKLAGEFGCTWVPIAEIGGVQPDILVNATPVGMDRTSERGSPLRLVPASALRRGIIVCDFANPAVGTTLLVQEARSRQCRVIDGGEIFRAQAALQSAHFLRSGSPR